VRPSFSNLATQQGQQCDQENPEAELHAYS
jgi:hypothetical protein